MIWSIPAPPEAAALLHRLQNLNIKKLDGVHLVEAVLAGANAFVTLDIEDLLKRYAEIKSATGVEAMDPEEVSVN
jgi:hypothetical protein